MKTWMEEQADAKEPNMGMTVMGAKLTPFSLAVSILSARSRLGMAILNGETELANKLRTKAEGLEALADGYLAEMSRAKLCQQ